MGIVTAAHPIAAAAGRDILRAGGNAVEAAVAVSMTLGVVEPFASGLGGGGFMMICPGGRREKLVILDGRGVTSELFKPERFYYKGVPSQALPRTGAMAPPVPGLGRMLALALKDYGGSLALPDILAPAIRAAEAGFETTALYKYATSINEWVLRANPETARIFLHEGHVTLPDLARSLRLIARDGFEILYTGEIGRALLAAINATGRVWSDRDLSDYAVKRRDALYGRHRGFDVFTTPPPSRGGRAIIMSLERIARPEEPLHLAEVFNEVIAQVQREVGDPDGGSPSTTHLTVVDDAGTIVALTQTLNHFFGSGFVIPGTGILMADDISEMSRSPGRPNSVGPRKRSATNMAPTIVFKGDAPFLAMGSPGFHRIITAQVQVLLNLIDRGMSLADAVAYPRIHAQEGTIFVEGHTEQPVIDEIKRRATRPVVVRPRRDPYFGGIHAVWFGPDGPEGAADPRRDGAVEVS